MQLSLMVNGRPWEGEAEPRQLLTELLRDTLGLTGAKLGCETGHCGTCVVELDGASVKSCTVLAVQAQGRSVTTVEGATASGRAAPLAAALQARHGVQCGFCTPGMVMSLLDQLDRPAGTPDGDDVRGWLDGTLCRCTGYQHVVDAVADVRAARDEAAVVPAQETRGEPLRVTPGSAS